MEAGVIIGVAATLTVLLVAVNFSGRGAQVIGGLFSPPGLGWPSGVQEDDDLAWHWPDRDARPEDVDARGPGATAESAPPVRPQRPASMGRG